MRFGRPGETWEHIESGAIHLVLRAGDSENMAETLVLLDPWRQNYEGKLLPCDPNDVTYRRLG